MDELIIKIVGSNICEGYICVKINVFIQVLPSFRDIPTYLTIHILLCIRYIYVYLLIYTFGHVGEDMQP